jgi:23S rRNA (adenine2030-N6)-methyltransferase
MNYRHIFHAGSFSDVFKHFIITQIIEKLKAKDTPFAVLDTHAGIGLYDLNREEAGKTNEYKEGIEKLWLDSNLPSCFSSYISIIKELNHDKLTLYPGSPYIARELLREQDKLILCELHKDDVITLKQLFKYDEQVAVHHQDAYLALKAFLPFKEKRGLVLIDPPFEKTDEWDKIVEGIELAYKHFRNGIYAIWYPIKDKGTINRFYEKISYLKTDKTIAVEFLLNTSYNPETLNGCGMVIINTPWQLEESLKEGLDYILKIFKNNNAGKINIINLV